MPSVSAIVAAATTYAFLNTADREGVVLSGRLGRVAVWSDGTYELAPSGGAYQAWHTRKLEFAQQCAGNWLALAASH